MNHINDTGWIENVDRLEISAGTCLTSHKELVISNLPRITASRAPHDVFGLEWQNAVLANMRHISNRSSEIAALRKCIRF